MIWSTFLTSYLFFCFWNIKKRYTPTSDPKTDIEPIVRASSTFKFPSKKNWITAARELINILNLDREVSAMGSRSKMTKLDVKIRDPLIPKEVITPDINE